MKVSQSDQVSATALTSRGTPRARLRSGRHEPHPVYPDLFFPKWLLRLLSHSCRGFLVLKKAQRVFKSKDDVEGPKTKIRRIWALVSDIMQTLCSFFFVVTTHFSCCCYEPQKNKRAENNVIIAREEERTRVLGEEGLRFASWFREQKAQRQ